MRNALRSGFNMPPGCFPKDIPGYYDRPCDVCGNMPDDCICPECRWGHGPGDPHCYTDRCGMVKSANQLATYANNAAKWKGDVGGPEAMMFPDDYYWNHIFCCWMLEPMWIGWGEPADTDNADTMETYGEISGY